MTFVERYGPWALVTGASATVDELSLPQPFKKYNLQEIFEQRFLDYPCFVCSRIGLVSIGLVLV